MSQKIILSLILATAVITPAAAGGASHNSRVSPPSLLGVIANVGAPNALAGVKTNLLNNMVKADVSVGASQQRGYGHAGSSLADVNVSVPGIARIQADVGQQNRHGSTVLGISANVLGGGVGHRGGW